MITPSPLKTVWIRPRETVRRVVTENPQLHMILFVCLAGIAKALDRASMRNFGDRMSLPAIIVGACIAGPIGSLFSLWVFSHLTHWTGRWIGGSASSEHVGTAVAWASVPLVLTLPLWVLQISIFGTELFTKETPHLDANPFLLVLYIAIAVIETILGIWSFVLLCKMIAEVQGFRSAWLGLGNILLSSVVIAVPVLIVVFALILF
jgi:hypothetical protein